MSATGADAVLGGLEGVSSILAICAGFSKR